MLLTPQVQHGGLILEDALRVVAELADVCSPQEEAAVIGGLPRARPQHVVDDPLV